MSDERHFKRNKRAFDQRHFTVAGRVYEINERKSMKIFSRQLTFCSIYSECI